MIGDDAKEGVRAQWGVLEDDHGLSYRIIDAASKKLIGVIDDMPPSERQFTAEEIVSAHNASVARPAVKPAALDEDSPMPKHWSVTVEKDGESHLTLSHNHYCGEPDLDEALIVGAAKHLLSFVGYGLPRSTFDPDADEQQVEPAAPVAEQEPVAWMDEFGNTFPLAAHSIDGKPLSWESAHKRKWKPLYAHPAEVSQEPDWRTPVEHRIRTWQQQTMNKSGDRLSLDDFMGEDSIDDLVDFVCDEWAAPVAPLPEPVADAAVGKAWDRFQDALAAGQVDDMATLIRRLVRALQKAAPEHDLPAKALDYLKRKGLKAQVFRSEPAAPVAEQEPVAYSLQWPEDIVKRRVTPSLVFDTEQEAVEHKWKCEGRGRHIKIVPLYTHPAEIRGETGGSYE